MLTRLGTDAHRIANGCAPNYKAMRREFKPISIAFRTNDLKEEFDE